MSVSGPDCPILVWMLSLNREYTKEVRSLNKESRQGLMSDRAKEYDACHRVVTECIEHVRVPYNPRDADSFRELLQSLMRSYTDAIHLT